MNTTELYFDRPAGQEAATPPELQGLPRDGVRLLVTRGNHHQHDRFSDLPRILRPGTVLVVNRSAVLPASLSATSRWGRFRLNLSTSYGNGIWVAEPRRQPTIPGPLPISAGDAVEVAGLPARFIAPYPNVPRLWFVRIHGDVQAVMQRSGEPIRYSYPQPPYPPLASYQTIFSDTPGSAEVPSAARPFTPHLINTLVRNGVVVRSVLLHCGVSSLEVEAEAIEDHVLYPEPFEVPADTVAAVNQARLKGHPGHRYRHHRGTRPGIGFADWQAGSELWVHKQVHSP